MKIYETLLTVRVGSAIQFFTNSEYKNEFLTRCLHYCLENMIYELSGPISNISDRDAAIVLSHFESKPNSAVFTKELIRTAHNNASRIMYDAIVQAIGESRIKALVGTELPTMLLSHFKIESTGAGECKIYWSRSIKKLLTKKESS